MRQGAKGWAAPCTLRRAGQKVEEPFGEGGSSPRQALRLPVSRSIDVLVSGGPGVAKPAGGREKTKKTENRAPQGGPGPRESGFALSLGFQRCLDLRHLRGWSSSVGSLGPSRLSTHFRFKIGYHAFCFLPQGALGPQEAGSGHYTHVFLFSVWGGRALKASVKIAVPGLDPGSSGL